MARIALCFDGTWDTPASTALPADQRVESNVSRIYESIATVGDDGVKQTAWYHLGVGTNWFDRIPGGVFGAGLDQHILDGYRFLVDNYQDGDDVYVFGFSRGAYTARSLVGMIRNCGLVSKSFADIRIGMAYGIYRTREDGPDSAAAKAFRAMFAREIPIRFVGVWDTVGALGIPLHAAQRLDAALYEFHDTQLSAIVRNAYHAIALDEHREEFEVCLWTPAATTTNMEQRWFLGAHGDVGGGETDRRLSDMTLRWMQDHAAACGLTLTPINVGKDNDLGPIENSYATFLDGLYQKTAPPYYRPVLTTAFGNEVLDPSINQRRSADPTYMPINLGLPALA